MEISLTPKQAEYIREANSRWNIACGAVRSGKSHLAVQLLIPDNIMQRRGLKGLNMIFGATRENIERNVLAPMRDLWGGYGGRGDQQQIDREVVRRHGVLPWVGEHRGAEEDSRIRDQVRILRRAVRRPPPTCSSSSAPACRCPTHDATRRATPRGRAIS